MRYYSYAGAGRGIEDPKQAYNVHVDEDMGYLVIVWSGNGYARRNAWIMAESGDITDLEENR